MAHCRNGSVQNLVVESDTALPYKINLPVVVVVVVVVLVPTQYVRLHRVDGRCDLGSAAVKAHVQCFQVPPGQLC